MEVQEEQSDFYKDIYSGMAHTIFELISFLVIIVLGNDFLLSLIATIANDKVTIINYIGQVSLIFYCILFRVCISGC